MTNNQFLFFRQSKNTILSNYKDAERQRCVCLCYAENKRACGVVSVSETIGDASHLSPSVWRRCCRTDTKPHLHLVPLAPTAHQTRPITA